MKQLKRQLQSVVKSLKVLTQKTEKIAKKLGSLEKVQPPKRRGVKAKVRRKIVARRPAKRVAKRPTKVTAIDTVLKSVQKRKRGITTAEIKKRTGFNEKKIWDIVNRAKRQGKVKSLGKGVYAKG